LHYLRLVAAEDSTVARPVVYLVQQSFGESSNSKRSFTIKEFKAASDARTLAGKIAEYTGFPLKEEGES
jgi:hypothetical protein